MHDSSATGVGDAVVSANSGSTPKNSAREAGHGARERDRQETARAPFEQQQLDREQHGRDRRAEHGGHAGRRAGHEQRLALGGRHVHALRDQRAERAARHDDRAFGAERAAAADHDARRQRLEHRHLRRHAALAEQDRLDRLRNAVAADLLGAEARHQPDDQPADHRHHDHPRAERVGGRRTIRKRKLLEEEQVREQMDQAQQHECGQRAEQADHGCQQRDPGQALVGREIAFVRCVHRSRKGDNRWFRNRSAGPGTCP